MIKLRRSNIHLIFITGILILGKIVCTVDSRYIAFQYNTLLHTPHQKQWKNINPTLHSQKTHHTSPWRARYGVSTVSTMEKVTVRYRECTVNRSGLYSPYRTDVWSLWGVNGRQFFCGQIDTCIVAIKADLAATSRGTASTTGARRPLEDRQGTRPCKYSKHR